MSDYPETKARDKATLVKEGGIPRYTIQSGAALNTVIEETVDPVLRAL